MAIAPVQHKSGIGTVAATSPAFTAATTSGNLVVLAFASDDYNGTPDTGWTQSTGMEQQGFHGSYIWWRISAGETSFSYTIATATHSAWVLMEFSGVDSSPYDTSLGQFVNTGAATYTTPSITPSAGDRLVVASIGASRGSAVAPGVAGTWTNSFTPSDSAVSSGTGTNDSASTAYLLTTADGSTGVSTGATYAGTIPTARSGLIIAFKAAAAGGVTVKQLAQLGVG